MSNRDSLVIATVVLVVVMALLLASHGETQKPEPAPSQWDTDIIELDKQALDAAYRQHAVLLFNNWLKEGVPTPATRAKAGFINARRGYIAARDAIEMREKK